MLLAAPATLLDKVNQKPIAYLDQLVNGNPLGAGFRCSRH
jgi:hypothetical protein